MQCHEEGVHLPFGFEKIVEGKVVGKRPSYRIAHHRHAAAAMAAADEFDQFAVAVVLPVVTTGAKWLLTPRVVPPPLSVVYPVITSPVGAVSSPAAAIMNPPVV